MPAPPQPHWILHVCEYECVPAGVCADACARVCGCVRAPIYEGALGAREAQTVGVGPAAPSAHGPEWYTSEQDLSRTEGLWAWPAERLTRGEA